jgi:DNA-binding response OmpR family regulator
MICIHRSRPLVFVNGAPIRLTPNEHILLTALGMLDNKNASHDVLLDVVCEGRVRIDADMTVLRSRIARLRRKVGQSHIQNNHGQGYILVGDVQFIGT